MMTDIGILPIEILRMLRMLRAPFRDNYGIQPTDTCHNMGPPTCP
jgi:hypothetical protein